MNSKEQVESLFEAARCLSVGASRDAFLDQACAGQPEMRAQLDALLSAETESQKFFDNLATEICGSILPIAADAVASGNESKPADPLAEEAGAVIGNYKLLQKIGEGGCGVVYMAEQERPVRRRVAFKIIKLGMDTKNVVARFEAERQALAMMDHLNIARVLDAGATATGRPYFVMELVRGVKITEYCDQNQLDTQQRLRLFIQVCHAIQHAHQKGIIHRDLKPSNILVTLHDGVPVPKVIDFGIVKATEGRLTDKTLFTAYEHIIGTPAYMSPEQAANKGLDVDTRTDIYSLGVLLYELLTGRPPFDPKKLVQSGLDEMRRTLLETEPQRPSAMLTTMQGGELIAAAARRHAIPPKLISQLKGDLDWIVLKCLEKDRMRRYETANGLAMDIERYLNNEPVIARHPSRFYQFQKLVRRNKAVFIGIAAVSVALVLGFGMSTWLFVRERDAHRRAVEAEREQNILRQAAQRGQERENELRLQAEAREKIIHATVLVSENNLVEADDIVSTVPLEQETLGGADVLRTLGDWNAVQGRWRQASDRFELMRRTSHIALEDIATLDATRCAVAFVENNDLPRYENFRAEVIKRFARTADPTAAERILKSSLLLPASAAVMNDLKPLAEVAARSIGESDMRTERWILAWRCLSLALWEYRQGNWRGAVLWSRRSREFDANNASRAAAISVIMAMSHERLGLDEEARAELARAGDLIKNNFKTSMDYGNGAQGFWFDWIWARRLAREAAPLILGTPLSSNSPP